MSRLPWPDEPRGLCGTCLASRGRPSVCVGAGSCPASLGVAAWLGQRPWWRSRQQRSGDSGLPGLLPLSWSWGRPEPWLQNRPRRLGPPGTRRAVTHRTRPCERLPWTPTHGGLPQAFQCFLLCGQSLSHSAAFRVQSRPAHTLRPQESLVPNLVLPPASPLPPPRRPHALPEPLVLQPALRPSSGMDPVAFLSRVPLISAVPEPESHKVAILGHAGP